MIRRLLPLVAAAVVLAPAGAATAAGGHVTAGPPVGSRGDTTATTSSSSAASSTGPAAGSASSAPGLSLSASRPLVVHGSRFAGGERVRVSFRAGMQTLTRSVRATPLGAFALTTPQTLAYDPCSTTLVVSAKGVTGDTAVVRRPPRGCAPG